MQCGRYSHTLAPSALAFFPPCAATRSQKVVVVDTSNEVAGDGAVPHDCIGGARRMMVQDRSRQHEMMVEAVQNHCPDVSMAGGRQRLRQCSGGIPSTG